jgi:hypothetical protein
VADGVPGRKDRRIPYRRERDPRAPVGNGGQDGQRDVVAGPADVADLEIDAVLREDGALRKFRKCAGDGIGRIVVDDREDVSLVG